MTLFSRCDATPAYAPSPRVPAPRRIRSSARVVRFGRAVSGFVEDVGILVRYAVGLDYYDRPGTGR